MTEVAFPDEPFSFLQAVGNGVPREALRQAVRSGELIRPSRGVYALPGRLDATQERWELARADHLQRLRQALLRFPTAVASHASAALLHDLELVISPQAEVELTVVEARPRSRRYDGVVLHHADSTETPWVSVRGIRVTSIPRTVADVLRTRRSPHAVAMLDRAVSAGVVHQQEVITELDKQRRWRGRPRALESLSLTDPLRESWLESYSFVAMHQIGMPIPVAQVDVLDEQLRFVGRVDGLLADGVFLEADGEGKYFLDADKERTPSEAALQRLEAERARHARLERLGLVGVRWTGAEIMREVLDVTAKINAASRRARRRSFRGWVRWHGRIGRLDDFQAWLDAR
jgi:hypothetical protein